MDEQEREAMQMMLRQIIQMIGLIPVDELDAHVQFARDQMERFDSIGAILDPTAWRTARATGADKVEAGRVAMIDHILSIRRLMDLDEALRQAALAKNAGLPPTWRLDL